MFAIHTTQGAREIPNEAHEQDIHDSARRQYIASHKRRIAGIRKCPT